MELAHEQIVDISNYIGVSRRDAFSFQVELLTRALERALPVLERVAEPLRLSGRRFGDERDSWEYVLSGYGVLIIDGYTRVPNCNDSKIGVYGGSALYFIPESRTFAVHHRVGEWSDYPGTFSYWRDLPYHVWYEQVVSGYTLDSILSSIQSYVYRAMYS